MLRVGSKLLKVREEALFIDRAVTALDRSGPYS
jgi:hypothetical protein